MNTKVQHVRDMWHCVRLLIHDHHIDKTIYLIGTARCALHVVHMNFHAASVKGESLPNQSQLVRIAVLRIYGYPRVITQQVS